MAQPPITDQEHAAWSGFLRTHERIWRALEAGLAPLEVSLAEYDVLVALADAGEDGLTMSELAARRLMSSGGLTRLADRLERRGLIERRPSEIDRRSFDAVLTAAGATLFRRARRVHRQDIRALFLDHLDEADLTRMAELWTRLGSGRHE